MVHTVQPLLLLLVRVQRVLVHLHVAWREHRTLCSPQKWAAATLCIDFPRASCISATTKLIIGLRLSLRSLLGVAPFTQLSLKPNTPKQHDSREHLIAETQERIINSTARAVFQTPCQRRSKRMSNAGTRPQSKGPAIAPKKTVQ